jgi:hypothetical protein
MNDSRSGQDLDDYISQVDLVRSFRGAPASIVLVLLLSGRPHTLQELEEATSYSDKPIRRAIRFLACRGVVDKAGARGWSEIFRPPPLVTQGETGPSADGSEPGDSSGAQSELAELLSHIGILSPAYDTLLARPELQAEPAVVQAWWWYVLTQNWSKNRPGLVIARLNEGRDPPAAFLALARIWPTVTAEDRQEMQELFWRAWTPAQMAHYFSDSYPRMTAAVFAALQSLREAFPDELL